MSTAFKKPNLQPDHTGTGTDPYISVRSDRRTIGISKAAQQILGAEEGRRMHLALDRTYKPWIAILNERTGQGEPMIRDADPGLNVNSTLLCRHLSRLIDGDADGVLRFYLTGETEEDPDTGATLYELSVPNS